MGSLTTHLYFTRAAPRRAQVCFRRRPERGRETAGSSSSFYCLEPSVGFRKRGSGQGCRDLTCFEIDESSIASIQFPVGVESDNQNSRGILLDWACDGNQQRLRRGLEKVSNPFPDGFVIVDQQNTQLGHRYVPSGREEARSFVPRLSGVYFSLRARGSWFLTPGRERSIQFLPYGLSTNTLAKSRST